MHVWYGFYDIDMGQFLHFECSKGSIPLKPLNSWHFLDILCSNQHQHDHRQGPLWKISNLHVLWVIQLQQKDEGQDATSTCTVIAVVIFKCWLCCPFFWGKITLWILMGWTCWNHLGLVGGSQMCWFLFQVRGSDQGNNTIRTNGAPIPWASLGIFGCFWCWL